MCVEGWRKTTKTFSHNSRCSDDTPNWQMLELLLEFICLLSSTERNGKGKVVPLQTRRGPEGSRKLRFPDFMTMAQDAGRVSAYAPADFTLRKCSWYSFLLQARDPRAIVRSEGFHVNEKSTDTS